MEVQHKNSDSFFATMISVPKEVISSAGKNIFASLFPFLGQPIQEDQQVEIVEEKEEEGRFILKIHACKGDLDVRVPDYFKKRISAGDTVDKLTYQVNRNPFHKQRLKAKEIVLKGIKVKLNLF